MGFDLVGVCSVSEPAHYSAYREWIEKGYHGDMDYLARHLDAKRDPRSLLPEAESIVAVGLNYNQPNPVEVDQPRISRYALGRDYHKVLRGRLQRLGRWLQERFPDETHRACVDSAPIMERDFAQAAGLGWFGKNTMLINSERGSWFFLGLLLTSVKFEIDPPSNGGCGSCRACVDACPTGAIVFENDRWQVDARQCISYLTIENAGEIPESLARKMGGWTVGCDVCQEVCPFNTVRESQPLRGQLTQVADFAPRSWPSLSELAVIDDDQWDAMTQGSAARRIGPAQWRRNARLNLRNQDLA